MNYISLVIFALLLPFSSFAQSSQEFESELKRPPEESFQWLFEETFPEHLRRLFPAESFKSFRVHLRDTYQVFPHFHEINAANLSLPTKVEGKLTYVGIIRKKYAYDILRVDGGSFKLNIRIHLKNATEQDTRELATKLQQAEDYWNASRLETDFNYSFKFEVVEKASQAHFSVFVLDSTRGPYDTTWGRNWSARTIAHEVGHMMGLGDEYQTITSKSYCLNTSIMCESSYGSLMPHHFYFILRRLMKLH